ncbi:MAG: hypothetical protein ACJ72O_17615 [Marmoricola sp.]
MRRFAHVAAAGIVLALVGVCAPAQAAASPSHWNVTVVSDLDPPVAGDTVELAAYLSSDTAAIAGRSATLLTRTVGSGAPFTPVATVTTDEDGRAAAQVRLVRSTAYRWRFAGDNQYTASSTSTLVQSIASKVVVRAADTTLSTGQRLSLYGRAYPSKAGNVVRVWMGKIPRALVEQPKPVYVAATRVRPDGTIRLTHAFASTGWKRLFVEVDGDAVNGTGFSNYVVVKVG